MTTTTIGFQANIANVIERAFWAGINTGIGILTADGFGWLQAETWAVLATAGVASLISMIKTMSQERMRALDASHA